MMGVFRAIRDLMSVNVLLRVQARGLPTLTTDTVPQCQLNEN
jgi:hypothetical protein